MRAFPILMALAILLGGCAREDDPIDAGGRRVFRIGVMPNLTHAPGLVGLQAGIFEERLGSRVVVQSRAFNAGPSVVEAIFAGELDVAYIGPNPAITAYVRTKGTAVRLIAGSTTGGAALVVQPGIDDAAELVLHSIASPAIGNTQDIAVRTWLHGLGYRTRDEGGSVELIPIASSDSFSLFKRGKLAGAWVPEPWASRLVLQADGKVLVDESTLWPRGVFPTTVVIATTAAIERRPDLVQIFVDAHREAIRILHERPGYARDQSNAYLKRTSRNLPPEVLERAFAQLAFSLDPLAEEMEILARQAQDLGYLAEDARIEGLIDPRFLPAAD